MRRSLQPQYLEMLVPRSLWRLVPGPQAAREELRKFGPPNSSLCSEHFVRHTVPDKQRLSRRTPHASPHQEVGRRIPDSVRSDCPSVTAVHFERRRRWTQSLVSAEQFVRGSSTNLPDGAYDQKI